MPWSLLARSEASHLNGLETFPSWSIANLAGDFAKIDHRKLNILSLSFIGLRILYNAIYAKQPTRLHGAIRNFV
ncbi:putative MAPEG family protein [Lyophyllum shimeji]|uniref:MAPEG family protein n=1 Tax=Lyophyllum shimeji TaxID=47721 RepID=A0A9P3UP04_LYOSH|nr:putative MAPEG family protein [Lyophyllum shimeji]